ncbi:hypothetical protein LCGC14_2386570, partial [marine sediment metagenome]
NIVIDEILQVDPLIMSTSYDLTLDGSETYYLPDLFKYDYEIITMIENITAGADNPIGTIYTIWGDRLLYRNNWSEYYSNGIKWSLNGNDLNIPTKNTTGILRIWYTQRPTGFFYATAESGSTTTAVIPATPTSGQLVLEDDYYNGMKCVTNNQVTRITDYVASTRTFTFNAQTTAISSSTMFDLMSPLPERYQDEIIDKAIRRALIGNQQDDSLIARYNAENTSRMKNRLSHKTAQAPKRIRKHSNILW